MYLRCCVLSFLWLKMANLSNLLGFELTVTTHRKEETNIISFLKHEVTVNTKPMKLLKFIILSSRNDITLHFFIFEHTNRHATCIGRLCLVSAKFAFVYKFLLSLDPPQIWESFYTFTKCIRVNTLP